MKLTKDQEESNLFRIIEHYELEDLIEFSKTVKVLYVDNDTELRYDYYGIFKIFFYDIDVASNGEEGLELFYHNKYDLIITAVDILKINGVEMITEIREISRDVTILALSSEEKHFIDLIRLGIDGYILSPVEVEQFVRIMQKVIDTLQNKQALYEYRIRLENKNKELEQRVNEEVEKSRKKDLKLFEHARLAAVGDMLSNIAHQWRQPLSVISTATTAIQIKKDMETLSDEYLHESLEKINYNTQYLSKIIDTFSKFVNEDKNTDQIQLTDFMQDVLNISKASLENLNIQVRQSFENKESLYINTISAKLSHVIFSILNNARDVLVQKEEKSPWIDIDFSVKDKKVLISIEDNGGGIQEDILSKIFEPYFTTKHQSVGTGLSLHISYRIVLEFLHGNLYAKNTQNGAKFFIELPLNN